MNTGTLQSYWEVVRQVADEIWGRAILERRRREMEDRVANWQPFFGL